MERAEAENEKNCWMFMAQILSGFYFEFSLCFLLNVIRQKISPDSSEFYRSSSCMSDNSIVVRQGTTFCVTK